MSGPRGAARVLAALLLLAGLPAGAQDAFEPQTWRELAQHAAAVKDWDEAAALWSGLIEHTDGEQRSEALLGLTEARIGQGYRGQARETFVGIDRWFWASRQPEFYQWSLKLETLLGTNLKPTYWNESGSDPAPLLPRPEPETISWPDEPGQLRLNPYGRLTDLNEKGERERGDYLYFPESDHWQPALASGTRSGGDSCQVEEQGGNPDLPSYDNYSDFYLHCRDATGRLWIDRLYLGTPPVDEDYHLLALGRKRELLIATGSHYTISRNQGRSWQPIALPEVLGELVQQRDGNWLLPSARGIYLGTPELGRWRLLALANQSIDQIGLSPDGSWWARSGGKLQRKNRRETISLPLTDQPIEVLAAGLWIQRTDKALAWSRDLVSWHQQRMPAAINYWWDGVSLAALGESVWLVNEQQLWHLDLKAGTWTAAEAPATPLAVAASGQTLLLASEGGYYRWAGSGWAKTGSGLPAQGILWLQRSLTRELKLPVLARLSTGDFRGDLSGWQPLQQIRAEYELAPLLTPRTPITEPLEPTSAQLTVLWQKYPDATGRPLWSGTTRGLYQRGPQGWQLTACPGRWVTDLVKHPQGADAAVCDDAVWFAGPQGWRQVQVLDDSALSLQLFAVDDGFLHLSEQSVTRFDLAGRQTGFQPLAKLKQWSREGDRWLLLTLDQRLWLSLDQGRIWKKWRLPATCDTCPQDLQAAMLDGDQIRLLYHNHWASLPLSRLTGP